MARAGKRDALKRAALKRALERKFGGGGLEQTVFEEAEEWRRLLADAGFDGDLIRLRAAISEKFGEGSLADLVAEFVIMVEHLSAERTRLEAARAGVGGLIDIALRCGQLRGRYLTDYLMDREKGIARKRLTEHGRGFYHEDKSGKDRTKKARKKNTEHREEREKTLRAFCQKMLNQGEGRKKNGKPNAARLADLYKLAEHPDYTKGTAEKQIGKLIRDGKLK